MLSSIESDSLNTAMIKLQKRVNVKRKNGTETSSVPWRTQPTTMDTHDATSIMDSYLPIILLLLTTSSIK